MKLFFCIFTVVRYLTDNQSFAYPFPTNNQDVNPEEFVFVLASAEKSPNLYSEVVPGANINYNYRIPFSLEVEPPPIPPNRKNQRPTKNVNFAGTPGFGSIRDSYGNVISGLITPSEDVIEIGVKTDVNRDSPTQLQGTKKVVTSNGLEFTIPSYASGITEIHPPYTDGLLPPTDYKRYDSESPSFLDNPEFDPTLPQKPNDVNEITRNPNPTGNFSPNLQIDPPHPITNGHVGVDIPRFRSNSNDNTTPLVDGEKYTGGFGGPPGFLGNQTEVGYAVKNRIAASSDRSQLKSEDSPSESHTTSSNGTFPEASELPKSEPSQSSKPHDHNSDKTSSSSPSENSGSTDQDEDSSFNQNKDGNLESRFSGLATRLPESLSGVSFNNENENISPSTDLTPPLPPNTGGFGGAPENPFDRPNNGQPPKSGSDEGSAGTSKNPVGQPNPGFQPGKNDGKYTGGFGGPPGSPFDAPNNGKPPKSGSDEGSAETPKNPFGQPNSALQPGSNDGKYTGEFGGPPGSPFDAPNNGQPPKSRSDEGFAGTPKNPFGQPNSALQPGSNDGKYTGGFGGPPGSQPIKSGSDEGSAGTSKNPVGQPNSALQPGNNDGKYTGGFGGPPGSPFDAPNNGQPPKSGSDEGSAGTSKNPFGQPNSALQPGNNDGKYTGGFGGPPGSPLDAPNNGQPPKSGSDEGSAETPKNPFGQPNPALQPGNNDGKYTGGFGGPPGSPFDAPNKGQPPKSGSDEGSAGTSKNPFAQPNSALQPGSNDGKYTGGFGGPPGSPFDAPNNGQPPKSGSDEGSAETPKNPFGQPNPALQPGNNDGKYTGGFGGPPGSQPPKSGSDEGSAETPKNPFGQPNPALQPGNNDGKYTGGFGGPPGSPFDAPNNGQPPKSGSDEGSAGTSKNPFGQPNSALQPGNNDGKYTGGFGGPPGSPFDAPNNGQPPKSGSDEGSAGTSKNPVGQPNSALQPGNNDGKYTGGFGGPPGSPFDAPNNGQPPKSGSDEGSAGTSKNPFGQPNSALQPGNNDGKYTGGFGGPPGSPLDAPNNGQPPKSGSDEGSAETPKNPFGQPNPALQPGNNDGKYTGGFGGPPGSPFDAPNKGQPPKSGSDEGSAGTSKNPFAQPNSALQPGSNDGKYTGGFGGPPGSPLDAPNNGQPPKSGSDEGSAETPKNPFGQPNPALQPGNNDGKYTGGFGGPPGFLGEQKTPGYAVTPNGIRDPEHQYRPPGAPNEISPLAPPLQTPPVPSSTSAGNIQDKPGQTTTKYIGGFGGPPGILRPYDTSR